MNTLKVLWAVLSGLFFIITSILMVMLVGSMLNLPIQVSLILWLGIPISGAVMAVREARERKERLALLHAAAVQAEAEAEAARERYEVVVRECEEAERGLTVLEESREESVVDKPLWQSLNLRSL